jgi:transcriptional regulator with XRE-family HTH domain
MNITVGNRLKQWRKAKNMSQEEVADFLHISQSSYARMERGKSGSWSSYVKEICELFEINSEELIKIGLRSDTNENADSNKNVVNQLSDKIVEQYEARIKELKKIIKNLIKNQKQIIDENKKGST